MDRCRCSVRSTTSLNQTKDIIMSKMWNLSRKTLRDALLQQLAEADPIRHRWLQEHPRSNEIVNQLTAEALQMMAAAMTERSSVPQTTTFWSTPTETHAEVQATVIDMLLSIEGLWSDLNDEFPRTPTKLTALDVTHELMGSVPVVPASAPTRNAWHRPD
jgi:hypothetical protein